MSSKGKKRQRDAAAKVERKQRVIQSGGKSKYAQKRDRARRGVHSPNSPFYVPPAPPPSTVVPPPESPL